MAPSELSDVGPPGCVCSDSESGIGSSECVFIIVTYMSSLRSSSQRWLWKFVVAVTVLEVDRPQANKLIGRDWELTHDSLTGGSELSISLKLSLIWNDLTRLEAVKYLSSPPSSRSQSQ